MRKSYPENKKIVYIIDDLLIGGAQKHLLRLAEQLANKGFLIEIVCLGKVEGEIAKNIGQTPIHIYKMDCIWRLYFWKNLLKLVNFISRGRPHIVHTYLNTANVFGFLAAKLAHIPIIITSRRDMGYFRSKRIGWLERITAHFSDRVVCVSEAVKQNARKKENLEFGKSITIYNGIDVNDFAAKSQHRQNNHFNISMVATMNRREKGHSYFVKAAEIVLKKRKNVIFSLYGDGILKPFLQNYVHSQGIGEHFDFKGNCENIQKELGLTDILVVPSESEGCSNALLESMARGIPVLATAVDGNLEIIEDGISGCLVRPRDPEEIADNILKLLDSSGRMKEIGFAGRKIIVEKFSLNKMASEYLNLYENLIQEKLLSKKIK